MRRIESIEDDRQDVVTYELEGGKRIKLAGSAVRQFGATAVLRAAGVEIEVTRLPVHQRGEMVGTLPSDFEPRDAKSLSPLYDIRPGDYVREASRWIASPALGLGDLLATPGFAPT